MTKPTSNPIVIAVYGLVSTLILSIVASTYLSAVNRPIPDGILAIGSASAGALATMLIQPAVGRRSTDISRDPTQ